MGEKSHFFLPPQLWAGSQAPEQWQRKWVQALSYYGVKDSVSEIAKWPLMNTCLRQKIIAFQA